MELVLMEMDQEQEEEMVLVKRTILTLGVEDKLRILSRR